MAAAPVVVQLNAFAAERLWSLGAAGVERLRRAFPGVHFVASADRESFLRFLPEAVVLFTWSLPAHRFAEARRLLWVHSPEAGVERLLFPDLVKSGVLLTSSKGLAADSIADHALALIYAWVRRLPACHAAQRERRWADHELWESVRLPFPLAGRTLLVVGLGGIGTGVARRAHAAGMTVLGIRRRARGAAPPEVAEVRGSDGLETFLPRADIVVLAAPATPEARRLLDAQRFALLRPNALVVNVGRGSLIDEHALIAALRENRLGGAALDVFEDEPLAADSPLWDDPRVIVTPHVAGTDPDHMTKATALFEENLRRFLAGEPLLNLVDKTAGY